MRPRNQQFSRNCRFRFGNGKKTSAGRLLADYFGIRWCDHERRIDALFERKQS